MYDPMTGRDFKTEADKAHDNIIPEFFVKAMPNAFRSEQEGRAVYDDVEMVRMIIPGDRNSEPVDFVRDEHRQRWAQQYAAFKEGRIAPEEGTPIGEWPPLSPAEVLNLTSLKIRTVEALAGVSDSVLSTIGLGARDLRTKAQNWLASADHGKAREAELQAQIDSQAAQLAEMKAQMAALNSRLAAEPQTADTTPSARRRYNRKG